MSTLGLFVEAFHFLRPLWLILLPVIAAIWWRGRRANVRLDMSASGIAPHLRDALTLGQEARRRLQPIDGVALILVLATFAAAGPTWSRQQDPFAAQSAPVVVVLKVAPSMQANDVAPARLERGKQKIRDFLELRAGARTALVAYAGSAHVVLPMTEDPGVMVPYLDGLSPDIMPQDGDLASDALALALGILSQETSPGGVLFVTDAVDPADVAALNAAAVPTAVLAVLPEGVRDRGLDALSASVVPVTADAADIRRIDVMLNVAYRRAMLENVAQPWEDRAHWLAWPAALLLLLWFRRGWTMRWTGMVAAACLAAGSQPAEAAPIDWFLTADQQGRLAFEAKDFGRAASLFADPLWRGYAMYRHGQYDEAVETLNRVDSAQAAFIQGMAHIKSRGYRDAIRSFETVLQRDPTYPGASENLAQAKRILDFIEETREQSDTGEDSGIGADEVVFDNEAARGEETQIEATEETGDRLLTTEQWMNTVETRTSDFLRQRFAIEQSQGLNQPREADTPEPASEASQ